MLAYIATISIIHAWSTDDASRQTTALQLLVAGMKCTDKDDNPLCHLYQEYALCILGAYLT